jgi:hypothetical protein
LNGHIYKAGARGQFDISAFKNILVVDDSIASGSAMIEVKESLEHLSDQFNIKYCAIYVIQVKMVDYYFETVPLPRYFQWNILNHTTLKKRVLISMVCCCPILCLNKMMTEKKYINFLSPIIYSWQQNWDYRNF